MESIKLFRPVKGTRDKDWRLTQWWGTDFKYKDKNWVLKWFYKSQGFNGHMGIDYAGPKPGDLIPVYAAHDGVVRYAAFENGWWNHIRISDSQDRFQTNYAHLSDIYVKNWEPVEAMQIIGMMGNTGTGTGAHLHFWLRPIKFDVSNGFKGYTDPTSMIVDWEEVSEYQTDIEKAWSQLPKEARGFADYSNRWAITAREARMVADIRYWKGWPQKTSKK